MQQYPPQEGILSDGVRRPMTSKINSQDFSRFRGPNTIQRRLLNEGRNQSGHSGSGLGAINTEHVEDAIALSKQALLDHSSLIIKINPNQQEGELIDMNEFTRLT